MAVACECRSIPYCTIIIFHSFFCLFVGIIEYNT